MLSPVLNMHIFAVLLPTVNSVLLAAATNTVVICRNNLTFGSQNCQYKREKLTEETKPVFIITHCITIATCAKQMPCP